MTLLARTDAELTTLLRCARVCLRSTTTKQPEHYEPNNNHETIRKTDKKEQLNNTGPNANFIPLECKVGTNANQHKEGQNIRKKDTNQPAPARC